jgi:hypothetical protein
MQPNRITHLSLMKYFTYRKQVGGIRTIQLKLREQGLELGIDGLNAFMWAYSHINAVDVVKNIYRVLRHNVRPESFKGPNDVEAVIQQLDLDGIAITKEMRPNELTYHSVIQIMAYHGHFSDTLNVFIDMLGENSNDRPYNLTMTVFRAVFLGFSRHGMQPSKDDSLSSRLQADRPWSLENLETIFDIFMQQPDDCRPSTLTIYGIMGAYDKTSGHDVALLRRVWTKLEDKFGKPSIGRRHRLRILREILFSSNAQYYFRRVGFHVDRTVPSGYRLGSLRR